MMPRTHALIGRHPFDPTGADGPRPDGFDVAPDGRRFLMSKPLAPALGEGTRLVLVQNWRAAMKK